MHLLFNLTIYSTSEVLITRHIAGDVKVVLNEGMPHHRNPFDKGRLIITFKVSKNVIPHHVKTSYHIM